MRRATATDPDGGGTMRRQLELDNEVAAELAGSQDVVLRTLQDHLGCDVFLRGNVLTLDGEADAVEAAGGVIRELAELIEQGHEIAPGTIEAVARALDAHESPAEILEDVVWRHRATKVAPKSVHQKRYVDSIRRNTITFGIGPAGTGKTFLAVALAAAALSRREVNRIILTRPAVEAGERLGFLPGDLMAKVDPYLRPLFDALHDMLDPERVAQHLERGAIEVAPLAFMRGRAQPLSSQVLTPDGFQPIGELRVGDLVTSSGGTPTPVLGVFPQGVKQVFRVRADDGARTLCCAEHLWHVFTRGDRRSGASGRTLEAGVLMHRLRRRAWRPRFELPLLSGPARFPARAVPIEPYALGRMLSQGTGLEGEVWHVGPRAAGPRGGVLTTDRLSSALRELRLSEARPATAFIPRVYLHNSVGVRLALLQGVLDGGGAPVRPRGGSWRIRYESGSERMRADVTFLVRSLGGIASPCAGAAELEIRLPGAFEPFRLRSKLDLYERYWVGRPMRFIESIEPAGEAECVCIQVAAADSLYVTDDFLVTHNTLNDSFIILDEAQNTTPEQMKMFLTRLGFNSKMVVTGDITQIDLPREQDSGLVIVSEILGEVEGIEFVRFGEEDVVRHKLVRRIVAAYNDHAQRLAPGLRPRGRVAPGGSR